MNGSIVREGCMGTKAIRETHTHHASGGRTLRVNKWAMDTIEASSSGKASFGVNDIPPALAQARAEGVRE